MDADVNGEPAVAASSLAAQSPAVAEAGSGDQARPGRLGNKLWRAQLREWLALLAGVRGVRGLAQAPQLRQAVAAQLLDTESEVQQAALRCLKVSSWCGGRCVGLVVLQSSVPGLRADDVPSDQPVISQGVS